MPERSKKTNWIKDAVLIPWLGEKEAGLIPSGSGSLEYSPQTDSPDRFNYRLMLNAQMDPELIERIMNIYRETNDSTRAELIEQVINYTPRAIVTSSEDAAFLVLSVSRAPLIHLYNKSIKVSTTVTSNPRQTGESWALGNHNILYKLLACPPPQHSRFEATLGSLPAEGSYWAGFSNRIISGLSFFFPDMTAVDAAIQLRIGKDPSDMEAFRRIVNPYAKLGPYKEQN